MIFPSISTVYGPAVLVAAIGFMLHSWPRWINRYYGVDNWRTLAVADYIRRGIPVSRYHEDRFLIPGASDYPPVFRWVVAALPRTLADRLEWAICPLVDALHSIFLFHIAWTLTGQVWTAILVQVIHMSSPLVMMENASMTTRPLASLLSSAAFFSLFVLPPPMHSTASLVVPFLFLMVLFLTHRFAIQALWVLMVAFTVWDRSWVWFGFYAAATAAILILSRGFYWKIVQGQFSMFEYWRRNMPYRFAHQVRGLPKSSATQEPDMLAKLNRWVVQKGAFMAVLAANPYVLLTIPAAFWLWRYPGSSFGGYDPEIIQRLTIWVLALLSAGVLIRQIPALRIIGEGERYLDYAVLPTALVVSAVVVEALSGAMGFWMPWVVAGAACLSLAIAIFLQYNVVVRDVKCSIRSNLWKMLEHLKKTGTSKTTVASIPLHIIPTVEYFTPCKVLSTDCGVAHIDHLTPMFPIFRKPVHEVMKQYGVEYLLLNESYAKLEEVGYARSSVVHQEGEYLLIKTGAV